MCRRGGPLIGECPLLADCCPSPVAQPRTAFRSHWRRSGLRPATTTVGQNEYAQYIGTALVGLFGWLIVKLQAMMT